MSAETASLAMYLDAPLQSWGYQSKFDRRTTLSYPTRSGVLGMICAAMGIDRADSAHLAEFAQVGMAVHTLAQHGRLTDFHTVGGGWDRKTDPLNVVRKAQDSPGRNSGDTVVTRREYLQDTRFGVVLSGRRQLVAEIADALRNPTWGIWLGRKSCIPASPVCQGVFDTDEEALARLVELAGIPEPSRTVTEPAEFAEGTDTLMDIPLDFAERRFGPRRVAVDVNG